MFTVYNSGPLPSTYHGNAASQSHHIVKSYSGNHGANSDNVGEAMLAFATFLSGKHANADFRLAPTRSVTINGKAVPPIPADSFGGQLAQAFSSS